MVDWDENSRKIDWVTVRLLAKDQERVPYIHWMFPGPVAKLEEVWGDEPVEVE